MRGEVAQALVEIGAIATTGELTAATSRRRVRTAVEAGEVVRSARGLYQLPDVDIARAAAGALSGVVSHLSAAQCWGWPIKLPPDLPQVLVPRGRNLSPASRRGVQVRWAQLPVEDRCGQLTSPVRTVLDCARQEPFEAALAVADSALRSGMVTRTELLLATARAPRTGRAGVYRVIEAADPRAANPFESVLRAICLDISGAHFEPQVTLGTLGRPDLVDVANRVILEADSVEFHAAVPQFLRDIERYDGFVAAGWRVLRFGWVHVMRRPEFVRAAIVAVLALDRPGGRSVRTAVGCAAA